MTERMRKLQDWGADITDAVSRMVDDDVFYFQLLEKFYHRREWKQLEQAIAANHFSEAFRIAHDLKGATSTLSLLPLWNPLSRLVEDLREEKPGENLSVDMEIFVREMHMFEKIMSE